MSKKIKVVHIVTGLIPGGAERLLLDMVAMFNTNKFDVKIISIVNNLSALELYDHKDQKIIVFNLGSINKLIELFRMRRYLKKIEPDIIHAHMYHSLVAGILSTLFIKNKPAICFTSHLNKYSALRNLFVVLTRGFRAADIIFDSDQHPNMNAPNVNVIPNGVLTSSRVPLRRPWKVNSPIKLLVVGRLADQKDPLGLLTSIVNSQINCWELHIVGTGPLECQVAEKAKDLGVFDNLVFHGLQNNVRHFMRMTDIFVMHSKYEGMPMALLEAGAEAMPVIATPVGSIPQVLGEDRGFLAPVDDFSKKLKFMVDNPLSSLAAGGRLYDYIVTRHSIDKVVSAHEELYLNINPNA